MPFAATFCKSRLSLILSRLLSNCDPLRWARSWFSMPGIFFVNTTRTGAKLALLRRFFYAAALTAAAACAFGDYLIT